MGSGRAQRTRWTTASTDPSDLPQALREALARVAARSLADGGAPVVVIDGRSGSGKTTLATAVAAYLDQRLRRGAGDPAAEPGPVSVGAYDRVTSVGDVQVAHLDDWYEGWSGLAAATATTARILTGDRDSDSDGATYRRWDWVADRPMEGDDATVRLDRARPLVIEGAGSLSPATANAADLAIWVDAPADERKDRALDRDGDTYRPYWDMWAAQEEQHVNDLHPQELADVVIRTDDPGNPFEAATDAYGQVRPEYPSAAIDALLAAASGGAAAHAPGHQPIDVADIGAGTGKMTFQLADRGLHVTAVEPSAAMRRQLSETMRTRAERGGAGRVLVNESTAEATGLPDSSQDLVVFAQSWHWVDPTAAAAEAHRILRPGGTVAAVWNQMDVDVPWVKRLTRIMRSGDVHSPSRPPRFGELFDVPTLHLTGWTQTMTPEQVVVLGQTRSSYLRASDDARQRMQANLTWYLHGHLGYAPGQPVAIPYRTLTWTAGRR